MFAKPVCVLHNSIMTQIHSLIIVFKKGREHFSESRREPSWSHFFIKRTLVEENCIFIFAILSLVQIQKNYLHNQTYPLFIHTVLSARHCLMCRCMQDKRGINIGVKLIKSQWIGIIQ